MVNRLISVMLAALLGFTGAGSQVEESADLSAFLVQEESAAPADEALTDDPPDNLTDDQTDSQQDDTLTNGPFLAAGEEPVQTDVSYKSQNVVIEIHTARVNDCDTYVADIYIRSLQCLRRAFANGAWQKGSQTVHGMAEDSGALLAITGDNAGSVRGGWVIGNGELLRKASRTSRDICVIYNDGVMRTITADSVNTETILIEQNNIWQLFVFGPALLDPQGHAFTKFNSTVTTANPRSVIGYYEPGHYCFVQVDGRSTKSALNEGKTNKGMTMKQLAAFMERLGCKQAYNLDGGQSSLLWFSGGVLSTPYRGGRRLSDTVIIVDSTP